MARSTEIIDQQLVKHSAPPHPRIWVVVGERTGDNAQVLRAAEAMGLQYEVKHIALKPQFATAKPRVAPSLRHIDALRSDALLAPWPDLVITIGRRLSLVALWIQRQAGRGCKIALFNAPKGKLAHFDLVVAPAFYKIADTPRVCRIGLPLLAADPARIASAGKRFADTIGAMKRPLNVFLIGGATGHMALDPKGACGILDIMRRTFASDGSVFVSTSRRTPPLVADAVEARLSPSDKIYRWRGDASDNPYHALLAHGDTFTVTGDSISMLTEIARLGKRLVIAELPRRDGLIRKLLRAVSAERGGQLRDFRGLYRYLIDGGHAVFLGDKPKLPERLPADDTAAVARRLRDLASNSAPVNAKIR